MTSGKIAPKAVIAGKLGANAVLPGNLGNGIITTEKIADGAVIAAKIKNGVVTTNKLNNGAVTTAKLGDKSVHRSASSATGEARAGSLGDAEERADAARRLQPRRPPQPTGDIARGAVSFQFPLPNRATVTVLEQGETSANCPGLGGGQTPQADRRQALRLRDRKTNLDARRRSRRREQHPPRLRPRRQTEAAGEYFANGQWAVTAP